VAPRRHVTGPARGALLGVGIDSVDIARFAEVLRRRPAVARRLFTAREQAYAAGLVNPTPSLAARFAAKEAVMKALGVGLGAFNWTDVEIVRDDGGRPSLTVTGRAEVLAGEQGVSGWHLSITHTDEVASAVVAAVT
jgi:holo-[acyl-carrier protein] synthase